MSDDHEGEGRRRRSRRGLGSKWIWAVVGVIVLLLLVNLGMSLKAMISGEAPEGMLVDFISVSDERMRHIGLWVALLPAAIASVQGVRWAHEAFLRSERPAALWLRRAFIVSLTAWIALLVVIMDGQAFESRTTVAIAAAALFSITTIPFAMAARAASQGRYGGRGPSDGKVRRRRRSSSGDHEGADA